MKIEQLAVNANGSTEMARKIDKTPKLCTICGDKAKGINFNCLTCMSCKAFFRRNALRNKEMKCPFNNSCQIDKEWILSDEEKRLIKEKILRNRLRRQQQELEAQQQQQQGNQALSSGKRRSMESQQQQFKMASGAAVGGKLQATANRRRHTASKGNFLPSGKAAAYRNRSVASDFDANSANSLPLDNAHHYSASSQYPPTSSTSQQSSSAKYSGAAAINAFNIFQEPSAYSLDILLSDNCDAFFESGPNCNTNNFNGAAPQNNAIDEWLYSNCTGSGAPCGDKKEDFLQSLASSDIDDSLALNLLFSNNMNSMDLFENENEIDGLTFSGSSSGISECNESNQSPMYENQAVASTGVAMSDMSEAKKDLVSSSASGHITSVTTASNSTFEYTTVKTEPNDFTQYLLHDNDPTFTLAAGGNLMGAHANNNNNSNNNKMTSVTVNLATAQPETASSNQIILAPKSFAVPTNNWESTNHNNNNTALQVVAPRYPSADVYGNGSKVPPLVKMPPPPPNPDATDFISNCLIASNDQSEEACNYDPVIEDVPRIGTNEVMLREIGFSNRELILPERCLIKELTEACSVLKNPYKRIIVFNNYDSVRSCRITEYSFHRLIRMSKRLSRFSMLPLIDQAKLLKYGLLEMLAMRSVLSYNPDRESWGFIDDKCKVNVMVRMDVIRPFSTKCGFQRHKNFPNLFRHEWKNDNIIFDLLTAIVLFTPRPGMCEYEKCKEEHLRYVYLLRRYLEIKYPTIAEAKESFSQLMNHIEEMRQLNADIMFFFRSYSQLLQTSPLFTQLLDLDPNSTTNKPDPFAVPVYGEQNSNMFNPQMDNMSQGASTDPNSSTSSIPHFATPTSYPSTMDSGTGTAAAAGGGQVGSTGAPSDAMAAAAYGVAPANTNANSSNSNAYQRECILNSAN